MNLSPARPRRHRRCPARCRRGAAGSAPASCSPPVACACGARRRSWSRCGRATSATATAASRVRVALARRRRPDCCSSYTLPDDDAALPGPVADLSRRQPHAARGVRPGRRRRRRPTTSGRGCGRPAGRSTASRCAAISSPRRRGEPGRGGLPVRPRRRRRRARNPGRARCTPGIIEPGHFRFQVVGEKVLRLEERLGYAHKGIEKRFEALSLADGAPARRPRLAATAPSPTPGPTRRRSKRSPASRRRRARCGCARCCSSASASPTTWAISAISATTAASRSASRSSRA